MEIREALDQERAEIFSNVHEVWPHDPNLKTHINLRLASRQHLHAKWYIVKMNDQIVASLAAYPYDFVINGESKKGLAIGAVHTVKSHRKQGLARKLMDYVHLTEKQGGASLSILFSDIPPAYYRAMGYRDINMKHGFQEALDKGISLEKVSEDKYENLQGWQSSVLVENNGKHECWLSRRHCYLACFKCSDLNGEILVGDYEGEKMVLNWNLAPNKLNHFSDLVAQAAFDLGVERLKYWYPLDDLAPENSTEATAEVPMVLSLDGEDYSDLNWFLQPLNHV